MKRIFFIIGLGAMGFWYANFLSRPVPEAVVAAYEIEVIDGDTIRIGTDRYRLKGFDTPETFRAECYEEEEMGDQATDLLQRLIATEDGLGLSVDARPDKFGRKLADAFVGDQLLSEIMIEAGLAVPYHGGKRKDWCAELNRGGT